ncbi:uncharacterized protein N7459_005848 [Penicillium hispanicum]|uniref:uncharacterized protein n=1 Tax=Penicillium hispanicum TaxID=1080232 RepID=UPI002541E2BD|nr:uncharacterized protein N7459_005848 [Penicillium hispanicum]KAJ5579863.1 hypothetical protein N7459_005848 [Penicillium hispanicum]
MYLPSPSFSFFIPSVHDRCQLDCRVYLPHQLRNIQTTPTVPIRGAIVAHPYASLGGCYDDPVVSFIGDELLQAGYVLGTFNFRGAGGSEGATSWTAKPELGDYVSFYAFMLQYLHELSSVTQRLRQSPGRQDSVPQGDQSIHLILGGYSYGSMIASHVPTLDVMLDLIRPGASSSGTPIDQIGTAARKIAAESTPGLQPAEPDSRIDNPGFCASTTISYLLVSPLLPPVSQLLTVFSTLSMTGAGVSVKARLADQLSTHRTLALFGDQDTFTSARKLQRWSADLGRVPQSQFRGLEIEGAGHFWREQGVEMRARQALQEWLGRDPS